MTKLQISIRIFLVLVLLFPILPVIGQDCEVDFPGISTLTFSGACGGPSASKLELGKNINMGDGDTFTFDLPIVNITQLHIDADGNGKIIIPAGVTVNLDGDVMLHFKNGQCTSANPCVFEIVVNGNANFSGKLDNDIFTLIWSGTGTVVVGDQFKNSKDGCMDCGAAGCPNIQVDPPDCKDDGSGCSGGDFCAQINNPCSSDGTPPVIVGCVSNQVINMTGPGCTNLVNWIEPTASDNCNLLPLTSSHSPNDPFPKGITTVTYTATDAAGNVATCSFNINVVDNIAPVITGCPANRTVSADASCQAVVNWTAPNFTDNCVDGTLSTTKAPGSTFSKGITTVTYTATDAAGNTAICSFNVNVVDNVGPVITGCPANITVSADASCQAVVNWIAPTVTDNCDAAPFTSSTHNPGHTFPIGKTEVTYTATDNLGNVSLCVFNVIVENENLPIISNCPGDIVLKGNEANMATANWVIPTASAQCGEVTMIGSHQPGDFNVGTTKIQYSATDDAGNTSYCYFNVIVSQMEIEIDISKVVTPDGNGMNDEWILRNIEKYKDNKVVIVDRWGGLIFAGTAYDNQNVIWRGTNRSGSPVPTGTYFYTISVSFGLAKAEKSGFIELIR